MAPPQTAAPSSATDSVALSGHMRDILDSLPDGVLTVDPEWRITSFNRAAERLMGVREQDAVGRLCRKVMIGDRCAGECPLAVTLETGRNVYNYEVAATAADGRRLILNVNTAVLRDSSGAPLGGVVSFRDVTLVRRLEEDLAGRTDFHGMIGRSRAMREIFEFIKEVADCDSTILIQGESGTGKELVARAVQTLSSRRDKPFIRVNCAAFTESLLESELFGHVRGAFTDARSDRPGRFEQADGGTIFLDEIGEASPAVQLRLLRILQEQEFERVGGNETLQVDVRVIAAANRPLEELIRRGRFRDDLFYRLNVIPIAVPPLRERPEDVIPLAESFIKRRRLLTGKQVQGISGRALARLTEYSWPGNVRELENGIEYAFVRCRGSLIQEVHLPAAFRKGRRPSGGKDADGSERRTAGTEESGRLLEALSACRWNRNEAAKRLGISRTTLWRKMAKLDLLAP